jgi:OmpA-OmpF porin, OOP family
MRKHIAFNGLALLGLFAGTTALAETQPGFYVGAGIGQATLEVDEIGFDADDTAFKVFGGYNFNQNFAVELAYFDAGKPNQDIGVGNLEVALDGINVSAVGRVPLGDVFTLFGKLGYASYDGEITGRIGGQPVSGGDSSDEDLSYGIGGAFNIGPSFELRAEYEAFDVSDGAFNVLSASGLFKF